MVKSAYYKRLYAALIVLGCLLEAYIVLSGIRSHIPLAFLALTPIIAGLGLYFLKIILLWHDEHSG